MAWEKLYVAEHDMAFRFFSVKKANKVPFQFFLICTQQGQHGPWKTALAQEDPQNYDMEIRIANREWLVINNPNDLGEIAQRFVEWATNFINCNYNTIAEAPISFTDFLYQP